MSNTNMELAIEQFAHRIGVHPEALLGLWRTAEEAKGIYTQAEREHVARQVLWARGDRVNGYQGGGFVEGLLNLWGRADMSNKGRLAMAFPVYATAIQLAEVAGNEGLLKWGTSK